MSSYQKPNTVELVQRQTQFEELNKLRNKSVHSQLIFDKASKSKKEKVAFLH